MAIASGYNAADVAHPLSEPNLPMLTALLFVQVFYVTMVYGPIAAFLVELFPTKVRYTSMSLPYHIGNGVFGGLVPLIGTAMVDRTGDILSGLYYPMIVASTTIIIGFFFVKENRNATI